MLHHIFTYGSLMFAQVWQRVVRGQYRSAKATVSGYARYAITGETYPAMVKQQGGTVEGIVYFDVDEGDTAMLDRFESADYRREHLQASLGKEGMQEVEAYIYLDTARLATELWQPEKFQLQHFLDTYCQTHREN